MASYLINKSKKNDSVISIKEIEGYHFKPHSKNENYIKVSDVTIMDHVMIDKILTMKFDKTFKKVVAMALSVINDEDADESDTEIVLDEVELVREILLNKYQKFIEHEKEELFLKKLRIIENEMRIKQVEIKKKAIFMEMEEKTHGRGR